MKMLSAIAIALLASSAAFAEPMGGQGGGERPQMMNMMGGHCMMMMQRTEGALAFLKAELKIEPSQDRAWDAFATAFRRTASVQHEDQDEHGDKRKGDRKHGKTQSFLEKAGHHLEMMDAHHESFKLRYEAAKALYNVLGTDQRKTADDLLMHYVMPPHRGMM